MKHADKKHDMLTLGRQENKSGVIKVVKLE